MLLLISYDVNTEDSNGKRRLRHVSKECLNYGKRVQFSVFECHVDFAQFCELKSKLLKIINEKTDSLRFYNLGNNYKTKAEHFGVKASYDPDAPLIV